MKQDYKYWKERVSHDGRNLSNVPQELKTPELCTIAVSQDSQALKWVPQELKLEVVLKVSLEKPIIKQLKIKTWFRKEISKKKNQALIYLYLGTKDPEIKEIFDKILTK